MAVPPDLGDPRQLRIADERYRPIPEFAEWATLRIDRDVWERATARLSNMRRGAASDDFRAAVVVAMRAAAVDTGAIEGLYPADQGFTMSVALQSAAWQVEMQGHGVDIMPYFEAQLRAYDLALDAAVQKTPISEAWIRALHEQLTGPQTTVRVLTSQGPREAELLKGAYKRLPNHVRQMDCTIHAYALVLQTPDEMHRFVEQLHHDDFAAAHPVLQAAYAHYCLVAVHPFQDGNGRVARALASVYLYRNRAASVPLVIFNDQKAKYLDALASADEGDTQAFVDFILDRTVEAIDLVTEQIGASIEHSLAELKTLLTGHGGLPHVQLDRLGYDLQQAVAREFEEHIKQIVLPAGLSLQVDLQSGAIRDVPAPDGYRELVSQRRQSVTLWAAVQSPAHTSTSFTMRILVAQRAEARFAFAVQAIEPGEMLDVRLEDVYPEHSSSFRLRLTTWTKFVVNLLLRALTDRTTRH
jgi:Fic family protein